MKSTRVPFRRPTFPQVVLQLLLLPRILHHDPQSHHSVLNSSQYLTFSLTIHSSVIFSFSLQLDVVSRATTVGYSLKKKKSQKDSHTLKLTDNLYVCTIFIQLTDTMKRQKTHFGEQYFLGYMNVINSTKRKSCSCLVNQGELIRSKI